MLNYVTQNRDTKDVFRMLFTYVLAHVFAWPNLGTAPRTNEQFPSMSSVIYDHVMSPEKRIQTSAPAIVFLKMEVDVLELPFRLKRFCGISVLLWSQPSNYHNFLRNTAIFLKIYEVGQSSHLLYPQLSKVMRPYITNNFLFETNLLFVLVLEI